MTNSQEQIKRYLEEFGEKNNIPLSQETVSRVVPILQSFRRNESSYPNHKDYQRCTLHVNSPILRMLISFLRKKLSRRSNRTTKTSYESTKTDMVK